jgi:hypothetical protein
MYSHGVAACSLGFGFLRSGHGCTAEQGVRATTYATAEGSRGNGGILAMTDPSPFDFTPEERPTPL